MKARTGFTVLEVLIALGIMALSMAAAALMLTSAFGTYRHQDRTIEVSRVVHDEMETLSATPYGTLATAIQKARRPLDRPNPDRPSSEDFQSISSGEAVARYTMDPPAAPGDDWLPHPKPQSHGGVVFGTAPDPKQLKAVLDLQYWDPEFDSPSLRDRGLIRVLYRVEGDGIPEQRAVKYLVKAQ